MNTSHYKSEAAMKTAATKMGISFDELVARTNAGEKRCSTCKTWKPRSDFPKNKATRDGLNQFCHNCRRMPPEEKARRRAATSRKMSQIMRGEGNPNYGKPMSAEQRQKLSDARKGMKLPEYVVAQLKERFAGEGNPNYGKRHSPETLEKMSKALKGKQAGEKHHKWKGGVSTRYHRDRTSVEYDQWRKGVFKRDNWICQDCGARNCRLNAHHLKSFKDHPELRFDLDNGVTLCVACHAKRHNRRIGTKHDPAARVAQPRGSREL